MSLLEIWRAYAVEAAWRNPGADPAFFEQVRADWHSRQGLSEPFPFPWGDEGPPTMADPFPEDF